MKAHWLKNSALRLSSKEIDEKDHQLGQLQQPGEITETSTDKKRTA